MELFQKNKLGDDYSSNSNHNSEDDEEMKKLNKSSRNHMFDILKIYFIFIEGKNPNNKTKYDPYKDLNNSLEISNFPQKKNEKKKMEKNEEEVNESKVENELKVSNTKLFEGLACLYQKQQQLEENQKRMEEKLDKILSLLIGKKMQIE